MRPVALGIKVLAVAGLFFGLVACNQGPDQVRTVFSVEGMHCDACSTSIVTTLEKVNGVEGAVADHETGIAEATYRPSAVDVDTLQSEIEKLGYTVMGVETETVEG